MDSGEKFTVKRIPVVQERISKDKVVALLAKLEIPLKDVQDVKEFFQLKTARIQKADKPKFTIPDLRNMTQQGLIDILGDLRERISLLKKEEGFYKQALAASYGDAVDTDDEESEGDE